MALFICFIIPREEKAWKTNNRLALLDSENKEQIFVIFPIGHSGCERRSG